MQELAVSGLLELNAGQVFYTGKLDDGSVFDSNLEQEPLQFEIGAGKVIPGFDEAVTGLSEGEKRTQHIPAAKAYGEQRLCILDQQLRFSCSLALLTAQQTIGYSLANRAHECFATHSDRNSKKNIQSPGRRHV